jgi:pectate lyase
VINCSVVQVMLFGAHNTDTGDREMEVTVAFNKFGSGLTQRMPRFVMGKTEMVNSTANNPMHNRKLPNLFSVIVVDAALGHST